MIEDKDTCLNGAVLKEHRDAGDIKAINDVLSDLAYIGSKIIQAHSENTELEFDDVLEYAASAKKSYNLTNQEALTMLGSLVAIARST